MNRLSFLIFVVMALTGMGMSAQGHRESLKKAGATSQQQSARVVLPFETLSDDPDLVEATTGVRDINHPGSGLQKVFRGKYHTVSEEGDTVLVIIFNEIIVFPPMKFKDKKQEDFYWRTVRDVKKTLPYAKLICETLLETYEYLETFQTQKEREKYMKDMESAIFEQYKPVMKKFTKNQAKMLVKLIQRQTNQSGYDILKAFLGSFRATFWQGFGKLFGVSLKGKYQPDKDADDAIIERVCVLVEQGQL